MAKNVEPYSCIVCEQDRLHKEVEHLKSELKNAAELLATAADERYTLSKELLTMEGSRNNALYERDTQRSEFNSLQQEFAKQRARLCTVIDERNDLYKKCVTFEQDRAVLMMQTDNAIDSFNDARASQLRMANALTSETKEHAKTKAERDVLKEGLKADACTSKMQLAEALTVEVEAHEQTKAEYRKLQKLVDRTQIDIKCQLEIAKTVQQQLKATQAERDAALSELAARDEGAITMCTPPWKVDAIRARAIEAELIEVRKQRDAALSELAARDEVRKPTLPNDRDRVYSLECELKRVYTQRDEARKECEALKCEIKDKRLKNTELRSQKDRTINKLNAMTARADEEKAVTDYMRKQRDEYKREAHEYKRDADALREYIVSLNKTFHEFVTQTENLKQLVKEHILNKAGAFSA